MTLCKYCKLKGMSLKEYEQLKENIKNIAIALIEQIPATHKNNGMYYPINELIAYNTTDIKPYLIQELKQLGIEFIEDYTLYRY